MARLNRNPKRVGKDLVSCCGMKVLPYEKEIITTLAKENDLAITDFLVMLAENEWMRIYGKLPDSAEG